MEIPEYFQEEAKSLAHLMPDLVKGLNPLSTIEPLYAENSAEMYLN